MKMSMTCFVNLELREHELSLGVNLFHWGLGFVKSPMGWYFNFGPFRGDYSDFNKMTASLQGLYDEAEVPEPSKSNEPLIN